MNGATEKQLNDLAKPIPKRYIKQGEKGGRKFDYVTARTVMNMLDFAVGRANWQTNYRVIRLEKPLTVECTLSIRINGEWVGKADVGVEENFSPEKAAYSNALKRAGAQWGIARELYGEGNVYEEDESAFDLETGEIPGTAPQMHEPAPPRAAAPEPDAQPDDAPATTWTRTTPLPEPQPASELDEAFGPKPSTVENPFTGDTTLLSQNTVTDLSSRAIAQWPSIADHFNNALLAALWEAKLIGAKNWPGIKSSRVTLAQAWYALDKHYNAPDLAPTGTEG